MSPGSPRLFVSGFLPSRRVPSGGQKLVHEVLREAARERPVVLLAFGNEREREFLDSGEFSFCLEARVFELDRALRVRSALRHPGLPLVASARFAAASAWMRDAFVRHRFSDVWIEFLQAASLLDLIPDPTLETTLVVHDLLHQGLDRRADESRGWKRFAYRWEARRTRRWEASVLLRPRRLLTLSEKDRDLIERTCGRRDVEVRYPIVDACYREVIRASSEIDRGTMLFWGQMSRGENVDAATWFARSIFPRVRERHPHARFLIAGAAPGPEVKALAGDGVEVLGFVEDPIPLFRRVELAVAPLRLGSGIKIKVIEYLAAGIPTVCSPVGAEGIRPDPLLTVASNESDFARACGDRLR